MQQVLLEKVAAPVVRKRWQQPVKRSLDVIISLVALIILAPVMAAISLAVKLDSRGQVLFRQTRLGMNGRKFQMYKFRSMCQDAEKIRESLLHLNEARGPIFKIRRDPRITRVGCLLRKTSLDELPQLINVLKGEMSLVGPRPPLPDEVEQYDLTAMRRLTVVPGMTCLWQISGRSDLSFDRWVQLDLEYIERQSIWLDISILMRTIPAVLTGRGAR